MMAKPMKTIELHYPMIQFLINIGYYFNLHGKFLFLGTKFNVIDYLGKAREDLKEKQPVRPCFAPQRNKKQCCL